MALSLRQIDSLMDLVEIKLGALQVFDREDQREVSLLKECLRELGSLRGGRGERSVVAFVRADEDEGAELPDLGAPQPVT